MVKETFYSSYKHIFIQCSHNTQKERKQIGHIEFLHNIGRTNCWEVQNHSKIINQMQRRKTQFRRKPLLTDRHLILIPPPDKKDKPTWCCIVCHKHEHEQRKESWCLCRQCSELFCIVPCFDWYHYEKILDEHYIRKSVYRFGT